jgi:hypothetical protein
MPPSKRKAWLDRAGKHKPQPPKLVLVKVPYNSGEIVEHKTTHAAASAIFYSKGTAVNDDHTPVATVQGVVCPQQAGDSYGDIRGKTIPLLPLGDEFLAQGTPHLFQGSAVYIEGARCPSCRICPASCERKK